MTNNDPTLGKNIHGETRFAFQDLLSQVTILKRILILIYVPATCVMLIVLIIGLTTDIPIAELTQDPTTAQENRIRHARWQGNVELVKPNQPWVGIVSNLGVLLWGVAGTACVLAAMRERRKDGITNFCRFLISAAVFSYVLMIDDLFLIHERIIPSKTGIPEEIVFATYASLLGGILVKWRKNVLASNFVLLFLAGGFFAVSISLGLLPWKIPQPHFFQDGLKFLGIAGWAGYWVTVAQLPAHS